MTVGSVAVLGEGIPVDVCDCGVQPGLTTFRQAVEAACGVAIPIARGRRLRPDACASCGRTMTMPVRRSGRAVTVTPHDAPVTTLRFDLPMQRCASCGLDQLPGRAHDDLIAAIDAVLIRAFDTADPSSGS